MLKTKVFLHNIIKIIQFIIKTPGKCHWRHSSIVTANFDQFLHTGLISYSEHTFPSNEKVSAVLSM